MCKIQNRLLGALIGLARATDGNEHLITPSVTAVIVESLRATDPVHMETLLNRVVEEKQKLVPNCFFCANPCGRTSDYDLETLESQDSEVCSLKQQIISCIQHLAVSEAMLNEKETQLLYKSLIAIGMDDFTREDLLPILLEAKAAIAKLS